MLFRFWFFIRSSIDRFGLWLLRRFFLLRLFRNGDWFWRRIGKDLAGLDLLLNLSGIVLQLVVDGLYELVSDIGKILYKFSFYYKYFLIY